MSLQELLKKSQSDSLGFELKFKQYEAKSESLLEKLKDSTDMNTRLREAVEELERRL